jgi:hypothetical protein
MAKRETASAKKVPYFLAFKNCSKSTFTSYIRQFGKILKMKEIMKIIEIFVIKAF